MKSLYFFAIALSLTPTAWAAQTLEQRLQEFDKDPQKFLDTVPTKEKKNPVSLFSIPEIKEQRYIHAKNQTRNTLSGRAAIEGNDLPEELVDNGEALIRNLKEMEKLKKGAVKSAPWSDHYWALYSGQTAFRYADENFPNVENWKKNSDFILKNLNELSSSSIDKLSPAEKYDLLVGDKNKTLTKVALSQGQDYYESSGKVETWMGICHGWAPASYMAPRPTSSVTMMAADGRTQIKFYPSDIKALTSLLWAQNDVETKFIGGRCNVKKPKKNAQGRVIDQDCFDTNPGSWHTAVVNQIGVSKRSMVMDATFDAEVWNHPIVSYAYTYFNPQTLKEVKKLEDAKVAIADFTKDKFKKFRSDKATHVVGISMYIKYVVETMPTVDDTDTPANDADNAVTYEYDLELDADGNIVGGEWYRNAHPDFLWTPVPGARALSPGDEMLGSVKLWDGKKPMPREWQEVATRNSEGGSPLAVIVESLIKVSNRK